MARVIAALRLRWLLVQRQLKALSSVALNNFFLCMAFLVQGSHSPRTAFFAALPFLLVLTVPLLFAMAVDTVEQVPAVRAALLPLATGERLLVTVAGLAMSPAFWLVGGLMTLWGGAAAGVCFVAMGAVAQVSVLLAMQARRARPWVGLMRYVPRLPGGSAA